MTPASPCRADRRSPLWASHTNSSPLVSPLPPLAEASRIPSWLQAREGGVGMVTVADDLETAPAGPVPQPDGIIPAGTGQQAAIGTPPHATHAPRMAAPELWRPSLCEAFPLPQADDAIEAGTRNCCAIGTPVQVVEGGCVALQHAQRLAPLP